MATTCPACGAKSATSDYCDSCGAALATPAAPVPDPVAESTAAGICPNCGAVRTGGDAFCEVCGLEFATGQMPSAPAPQPVAAATADSGWVAVVEADRAFHEGNDAGTVAFPEGLQPREIPLVGDEIEIGRRSEAKGYFPAIDLAAGVADPAVSHHHARLQRLADGSWSLVDGSSTNGTWLNDAQTPLTHGAATVVHDGDHINIGLFTRITFRRTTK